MEKFVEFISPKKISMETRPMPETFHTFQVTDEGGNQSFFHCFTYYEVIDEYQIIEDFDYESPLVQQEIGMLNRQKNTSNRKSHPVNK